MAGLTVVDRATAGPAYPRYERLALRLIGVSEFVWLGGAPAAASAARGARARRPNLPLT